MDNEPETDDSSTKIVAFPAQILHSCCTHCKQDLTFLIRQMHEGTIGRPHFCPLCQTPFQQDVPFTEDCWVHDKPGCMQRLTGKEVVCPNCGDKLVYPKGFSPEAKT